MGLLILSQNFVKTKIILLVFFISHTMFSQTTLYDFHSTDNHDFVRVAKQLPNEKVVLLINYSRKFNLNSQYPDFTFWRNQLASVEYVFSSIELCNKNLQIIDNLKQESNEDTITIVTDFQVLEELSEIVFFGNVYFSNNTRTKMVIHTDFELNEIKRTFFNTSLNFSIDDFVFFEDCYVNKNYEYMVSTNNDEVVLIDSLGNFIQQTNTYFSNGYTQLPDGSYINAVPISYIVDLRKYNTSFNEISAVTYQILDTPTASNHFESIYFKSDYPALLSNAEFLYFNVIVGNINNDFYESVVKVNTNDMTANFIYKDTLNKGSFYFGANNAKSIDARYKEYIYFGNEKNHCSLYPTDYTSCNDEYITLNCIDDEGTLNWSKVIGGDANYYVTNVIATIDTGVIVFVDRFDYLNNNIIEFDIYAIKFDKNGNEVNIITVDSGTTIEEFAGIITYPNPANNILYFDYDTKYRDLEIAVFDIAGKKYLRQKLSRNMIDISNLPKGNYRYLLKSENTIIKNGSFVKL